jgi:hypothetical protein
MGLLTQIEKEIENFCDNYCKYNQYFDTICNATKNKDMVEIAQDELFKKHCNDCPITRISY